MKERPILFSAAMIRAILEDRKTQTRRIIKGLPVLSPGFEWVIEETIDGQWEIGALNRGTGEGDLFRYVKSPRGVVGDRLCVREAWLTDECYDKFKPSDIPERAAIEYPATDIPFLLGRKRPSIFMMRWMSRITLEVINVRVERVQDIAEDDCECEGIFNESGLHLYHCDGKQFHPDQPCKCGQNSPKEEFAELWDSTNGKKHPWESNPWVWVYEFRRIK